MANNFVALTTVRKTKVYVAVDHIVNFRPTDESEGRLAHSVIVTQSSTTPVTETVAEIIDLLSQAVLL